MDRTTVDCVLQFLRLGSVTTLDITGGAPELNPHFKDLVWEARQLGLRVIDRCNLTVLEQPEQTDLAEFLAQQGVEITASLPCYLENNVDAQRGEGVFTDSIRALQRLNRLGYGQPASELVLNLVYNPQGPRLPPEQIGLEADYKRELHSRYGIAFHALYTLANMPIQRFGSTLISRGEFGPYMELLRGAYVPENRDHVMCRTLISVDWQGYVYDCDFNQMLGIPLTIAGKPKRHLRDLMGVDLVGNPIAIGDHCYGCTAGQGSSCGGALS
jgi:radical SAM/Cys-rich protein